ncbi:BCD family MFS transporter [Leptothoe sp. EHU-05/26/07-4]
MSSPDLTDRYTAPDQVIPKISMLTMLRLGAFNAGLGIMSVLTLGVLNRIMIDELQIPALIAAGTIAVHQFMAPARIWFGQMSDAKPLFGHHRSSYIWLGIVAMAVTAFLAIQVVWQIGAQIELLGWGPHVYPWVGLLALMFALYGLALSSTSTPFTALLVDVSDEDSRSRLIGIGWFMLMFGIILAVILTTVVVGGTLDNAPTLLAIRTSINRLFIVASSLVCVLAITSTFGIEKKYSRLTQRSDNSGREDQITLGTALKVLTASRQTGLFFGFLLVLSLSLFMQDAVLEPYGGQVFGMAIEETTQLNGFFGSGTGLGILLTAFLFAPKLGKKRTIKMGCLWAAFCLTLLIVIGATGNPKLLVTAVGLFGLASGVLTTGSILLMLDLTIAEVAGTFVGAWGLAQAIARGVATVLGGGLLTLGKNVMEAIAGGPVPESQLLPAYGLVFGTQAVGMLVAVAIVSRVNIREFQTTAQSAIATALESDMD